MGAPLLTAWRLLGCTALVGTGCGAETPKPAGEAPTEATVTARAAANPSTQATAIPGGGTANSGMPGSSATANSGMPASSATGAAAGNKASCKRGVGYGHHSVADLQALSAGVSWWYNWDFHPDAALRGGEYLALGVEYVPMIWGAKSDPAAAKVNIGDDARVLLGFNEPNFGAQANISAQAAAALWPQLQAIAQAKSLRLVSPAVNFCGGDCQDTDPFHYLEEFFAACKDCQVDAVAMHIYVGCSPTGKNKAEWLIQHVETYKRRFSQPLWLTEFACDSAKNADEQQAFLVDAVAYLEGEPRIERYAWFAGRADNVPHVDLLGESGVLTTLGAAYVNAPRDPSCSR